MPAARRQIYLPAFLSATMLYLGGCARNDNAAFQKIAGEPLDAAPWTFSDRPGNVIQTGHYRIYTTIDDPLYEHLISRVLEAAHARAIALIPDGQSHSQPLDCYIFASRNQWERYTRDRAGSNAPIYLQISSGGYCQEGVFAGYDIGRDQTLSVIAHEAWHQYSWFAFKDRLPAWLEEGMATQNEAIVWNQGNPEFHPAQNARRLAALRLAVHANQLWKLEDLVSTHAGRVIKMPQAKIDAYYAQLWSLVLFLQESPDYGPRLKHLLVDAAAGTLAKSSLAGTSVTQQEIDDFTEHWNSVAGAVYLEKYINASLDSLDAEYRNWLDHFIEQTPGING